MCADPTTVLPPGASAATELQDLLPDIINQLGPDSISSIRKLAESYQAPATGAATGAVRCGRVPLAIMHRRVVVYCRAKVPLALTFRSLPAFRCTARVCPQGEVDDDSDSDDLPDLVNSNFEDAAAQ